MKRWLKGLLRSWGWSLHRIPSGADEYAEDWLWTPHDHDFVDDPRFRAAYARGVAAAADYDWRWRVHVGLWAARTAVRLPGDFVECGVNRGFLSSAIMADLDWDSRGKTFYLLDTFAGLDPRFLSGEHADEVAARRNAMQLERGFYLQGVEAARANFAEWKRARIVQGSVPESLAGIDSARIAYLHLDMNSAPPEVAALTALWPRLVPGAIVLLDDYAYHGYRSQKLAMDEAARTLGASIAALPTGQGLIVRTPDAVPGSAD